MNKSEIKRNFILILMLITLHSKAQKLFVNPLFSDAMVLQQQTDVKIWGTTSKDEVVKIICSWGVTATSVADANGAWIINIHTSSAGGPFVITIETKSDKIEIKNVMLGEVWLCSGQSNMEMPIAGWPPADTICNSDKEIKNSLNPKIRMFNVQRAYSLENKESVEGKWEESTPQTSSHFSATAYFFAQKMYSELKIPIGIINSSWGGTPVESWISGQYLKKMPDFVDVIENQRFLKDDIKVFESWLQQHEKINVSDNLNEKDKWKNLNFNDSKCSSVRISDKEWNKAQLPGKWEGNSDIGEFDGVIWYRKHIIIPDRFIEHDLVLILPPIDDMDQTYVNGELVGGIDYPGMWNMPRVYTIPYKLVKNNEIVISIRVLDNQGGGGIGNPGDKMLLALQSDKSDTISLSGEWKYNVAAFYRAGIFYVINSETNEWATKPIKIPLIGQSTPSLLFNAMISPLISYAIKGVLWYQGETNVGRAEQYVSLLPLLIQNWRDAWKLGEFPFYVVQIAPWIYSGLKATDGAELRSAQFDAVNCMSNCGIVSTLDIGDISTIHPGHKKEVGERLALLALGNYKDTIRDSGPIYVSQNIENDKIILKFKYASKGLVLKKQETSGFEIASEDKKYVEANVKIIGDMIVCSNPAIRSPKFVRYAFYNASAATLFNKEGLPAPTFQTK